VNPPIQYEFFYEKSGKRFPLSMVQTQETFQTYLPSCDAILARIFDDFDATTYAYYTVSVALDGGSAG